MTSHSRSDPASQTAGDRGSISVFTLGWIVVALMAIAVLVGATQVHLDRLRLVALADELALVAAGEATQAAYLSGAAGEPELSERASRESVEAALASGSRDWHAEVVVAAVSVLDETVEVTLQRPVVPLVGDRGWLPTDGVTITAQGSARVG